MKKKESLPLSLNLNSATPSEDETIVSDDHVRHHSTAVPLPRPPSPINTERAKSIKHLPVVSVGLPTAIALPPERKCLHESTDTLPPSLPITPPPSSFPPTVSPNPTFLPPPPQKSSSLPPPSHPAPTLSSSTPPFPPPQSHLAAPSFPPHPSLSSAPPSHPPPSLGSGPPSYPPPSLGSRSPSFSVQIVTTPSSSPPPGLLPNSAFVESSSLSPADTNDKIPRNKSNINSSNTLSSTTSHPPFVRAQSDLPQNIPAKPQFPKPTVELYATPPTRLSSLPPPSRPPPSLGPGSAGLVTSSTSYSLSSASPSSLPPASSSPPTGSPPLKKGPRMIEVGKSGPAGPSEDSSSANIPNRISFNTADTISDAEKLIMALQKQWIDEKSGKVAEGKLPESDIPARKPRSNTGDFGGRLVANAESSGIPPFQKAPTTMKTSDSSEGLKEVGSDPHANGKATFLENSKASAPLVSEEKSVPDVAQQVPEVRVKRSKSVNLGKGIVGVRKMSIRETADKVEKDTKESKEVKEKEEKDKKKKATGALFWPKKKESQKTPKSTSSKVSKSEQFPPLPPSNQSIVTLEQVEIIAQHLISHFLPKIETLEGLFRISGPAAEVAKLKDELLEGKYDTIPLYSEHTCASVMKTIYREANEPLIPPEFFERMIAWHDQESDKENKDISALSEILVSMDPLRVTIMREMLRFLVAVASYSEKNMMTPTNLGIVFSPNVLQSPEDADVFRQFEDASKTKYIMQVFIEHFYDIFPDERHPSTSPSSKKEDVVEM